MPAQPDREITIASGQTASSVFGTGQGSRGAFQLPATMDGTSITIQVSNDATNWTTCPIETSETNPRTTAASGTYDFPIRAFSFKYIRLLHATAQTTGTLPRVIPVFTRD